ncbi:MAG: glycosyltransferase [Anaerolineaceae bacterium]|nr:glycosyltransferase [Anaerolineaceae bacterium]
MNKQNELSYKFSIITPVYNRVKLIEKALDSLHSEGYSKLEHIIVDGGSNDGTLELLGKYPSLKVISGPDEGVYDAINKGIKISTGEIIGILNSDDYFEPNCLYIADEYFRNHPECDILVGNALVVNKNRSINKYINSSIINDPLYAATFGTPIPNAWFVRRNVFSIVGFFNNRYKIVADRDFLIRLYYSEIKFCSINKSFYNYLMHEDSLTFNNDRKSRLKIISDSLLLANDYYNEENNKLYRRWLIYLYSEGMKTAIVLKDMKIFFVFMFSIIKNNPLWLFGVFVNFFLETKRIFNK